MKRSQLILVCLTAFCLSRVGRGEEPKQVRERLYAWKLGTKLSLCAWAHYKGAPEKDVQEQLDVCRELASKGLNAQVPAFPKKTGDDNKDAAQAMDYITVNGGKVIGRQLATRYGNEMASLFELAMKARAAVILYQPKQGDSLNASLESALARSGAASGLPEALWKPLVTKIKELAPHEEVRNQVKRLDDEVTRHLLGEIKMLTERRSPGR